MEMKDVLNSFKRLYGDFRAAFKQINEWEVEKKRKALEKKQLDEEKKKQELEKQRRMEWEREQAEMRQIFFQIVLEELNKRCVFTRTTLFVGLDGIAKISEKNIDEKLLKSVLLHDESFIRNEIEKEISNIRKKVADVQLQLQNCEETAEQLNYELQMCTTRERACELRLKQSLNRREFNRLTLNSNVKELLKQIGKLEFVLQNWAVIKQIKFSISANREFLKCYIVEKSCAVEARNEAERS